MGAINKVFMVSKMQPEQQKGRQAGAFNLLWRDANPEAADSFLGPQSSHAQRTDQSSGGATSDGQACCRQPASADIDWRKGAYAIRFQGNEFVTSKALAHGGAAVGGDAKVGSRYSSSAGVADVHAQPDPVQPAAGGGSSAPGLASSARQDVQQVRQQQAQQLAATMWIAGSEARAMEERDQVGVIGRKAVHGTSG